MQGHAALAGIQLTGDLHEVHAAVVVAVGHEDDGAGLLHGVEGGGVDLQAVTHAGHAAEDGEIGLQLVDAGVHGGTVPRALLDDGAVGADGVQTTVVIQRRDGGVDALEGGLGRFHLGLLEILVVHHHGTGIVHDEVKALDLLVAHRGRRGGNGIAEHEGSSQHQQTNGLHKASHRFSPGSRKFCPP